MSSLLLFSGFGAVNRSLLQHLRGLYARPAHRPLLLAAAEAVERALDHAGPDVVARHLPRGLPLRDWLTGSAVPNPQDLQHSVVEGTLTHVYQMCLVQPDPRTAPAVAPSAGIGHSLGVVAATVAGLDVAARGFVAQAAESTLFVTLGLLRCHEVAGSPRADPELARRYATAREEAGGAADRPSPMASVNGLDAEELADVVAADGGTVEVGLVNTARGQVLTGGTDPLLRFWHRHGDLWNRSGVRWSFVRATAPFHSRVLAPALPVITADREALGASIPGSRLRYPVWSMDGTRNLQQSPDVIDDCMEQVFCTPVDWSATVRAAVSGGDPHRVVDYGPGVAVRVFTRESLQSLGLRPQFAAVAVPR